MANHVIHVYCQQRIAPGVWCSNKAVAPDPRSPRTSSLCRQHLNEAQEEVDGA